MPEPPPPAPKGRNKHAIAYPLVGLAAFAAGVTLVGHAAEPASPQPLAAVAPTTVTSTVSGPATTVTATGAPRTSTVTRSVKARTVTRTRTRTVTATAQGLVGGGGGGGSVFYANCSEARAAGDTPLYAGDPGYSRKLDRDGDGVACE